MAVRKKQTSVSPAVMTTSQTQVNSDLQQQQQQQQQPSQSYMYNQHSGYSAVPFSPMQSPNGVNPEIHFSSQNLYSEVRVGEPVYAPPLSELHIQDHAKPLDVSRKSVY